MLRERARESCLEPVRPLAALPEPGRRKKCRRDLEHSWSRRLERRTGSALVAAAAGRCQPDDNGEDRCGGSPEIVIHERPAEAREHADSLGAAPAHVTHFAGVSCGPAVIAAVNGEGEVALRHTTSTPHPLVLRRA